jgi:PAS domain-containing protein
MNGLGIILLITASLLILLSTYSFLRAHSHGAIWFGIFLSAVAVYSIGYAFEISSNNLKNIMFWLHIEYLGISFLAPMLILFPLHFCGFVLGRNNWFILFLLIISLFTLFTQLSDPYLHLFYKSVKLEQEGSLSIIHFSAGIPYWLNQLYSIIGMIVYSWLFFLQALKTKGLHRQQAWLMVAGSIVPWLCYVVYITGNSPARIDLIPFSFIAMGIICAWGMFRYEFFDFAPPDLDKIFKNLNDAIIIFDYKKRITHTNPAAEKIFNLSDSKENVLYAETVFANIPDISSTINSTNETSFDFQITRQNETSYFQARISPLQGNRRRVGGKIMVLTDITKH